MITEVLKKCIVDALQKLGIEATDIALERPDDFSHGDHSSNIALILAKKIGRKPSDVAESITSIMHETIPEEVEKVEIAGPGFINFHLKPQFFENTIKNITSSPNKWGRNDIHQGKEILVEHSSPNLFKPFHIGHLMNNAIGESITRLARFSGANVTTTTFPSDVSLGIGKAVWAMLEDGIEVFNNKVSAPQKLAYLGDCYVRGTKAYDEDESIQKVIRDITAKLYEKTPGPALEAYELGKELSLLYFKSITTTLGSTFDGLIFESEAGVEGKRIVEENIGNVFEKSDGAIIYKGEQDGLHTRVFINKEGYPTYEGKDTGLIFLKFEKFKPDLSIFITDHEQSAHFDVVLAAAKKINSTWALWVSKSIHRTHGRMSFKGQKMSSRLGGVPLAQDLLEVVKEDVYAKSEKLEKIESADTAEQVAIAAIKFSILRAMAGKNINFDPETSLSFEGDSGPYLQYSTVRAHSIIVKTPESILSQDVCIPENWIVTDLEKQLIHFPRVVARSIDEWAPHHIVGFLLELAQAFNSWYATGKIIDETDPQSRYKVELTKAFYTTMKNGLYLLGIEVPGKM